MNTNRLNHAADFLDHQGYRDPHLDKRSSPVWDVYATLDAGDVFCPNCKSHSSNLIQKGRGEPYSCWDAPVRGYSIRINVTRQWYRCQDCGQKYLDPVPGIAVHHRTTLRGVDYILHRVGTRRWTVREVAAEVGPDEKTIRAIFMKYAEELETRCCDVDRQRFEILELKDGEKIYCSVADKQTGEVHKLTFAQKNAKTIEIFLGSLGKVAPRRLAIDEFYFRRRYICILYDLENGQIFDMIFDRDNESAMAVYFTALRGRESVEIVTMDRSKLFRALIEKYFPKAKIIADRWHLSKNILDYFKKVRTKIEASLEGENKKEFSSDSYKLLKHGQKLISGEQARVDEWVQSETELGEAYRAKEGLLAIWRIARNSVHASQLYADWRGGLSERQREHFAPLINSFDDWADAIFAYFDHEYTNAIAESLNRISRERVRKARGCSYELLRAVMIYPLLLSRFMAQEAGKSGPVLTQVPIAELLLKVETDVAQNRRAAAKPNPGLFIVEKQERTADKSPAPRAGPKTA